MDANRVPHGHANMDTYRNRHQHALTHGQLHAIEYFHYHQDGHAHHYFYAHAYHHAHFHLQPDHHAHLHSDAELHHKPDLQRLTYHYPDLHGQPYHYDHFQRKPHYFNDKDALLVSQGHPGAFAYPLAKKGSDMSKVVPLLLADGSGGLNTRDPKSGILKNQFSKLENYLTDERAYFRKRRGQGLIQNSPIGPESLVATALTAGLWNLDEASGTALDSSGNGFDLVGVGSSAGVTGILPVGAPVGRSFVSPDAAGSVLTRQLLACTPFTALLNAPKVTFRAWINVDPRFTGKTKQATNGGLSFDYSDSGSPIIAECATSFFTIPGALVNGLSLHRDWDSVNQKDASGPYVKFTLATSGIAGTVTVIQSGAISTSRWNHLKGVYDSTTGLMRLYVNANLVASASVVGGGLVNSYGNTVAMGGNVSGSFPASVRAYRGIYAILDDVAIDLDAIETFPFKNPRGEEMVLEKSDGTRQVVIAADQGLYYTVGDGSWSLIKTLDSADTTTLDPATGAPISATADWSGVMIDDRLYMTNGFNTPMTWDGNRVVPTGEGVTPLTLSLSAGGTTNANGDHKYTYAYKYGTDITGFGPISTITVTSQKDVNIQAIPSRHANCSSILIFKTKAGGTAWFLDREVTNNSTVNTIDLSGPWVSNADPALDSGASGTADATLGTGLYKAVATVDPRISAAAIKKNKYYLAEHLRLFGCGSPDFPYDLSWSALANPDVFRATAFVSVGGDKGPLVGMATDHGEIVLSKNANGTSVLHGTDESNWTLTENIHPKVGARDHWSFAHRYPVKENGDERGDYVLCFVGSDGIYEYFGQKIQKVSDIINPTFAALAVNTSSKSDWVTSDQTDFQQAASQGGASSVNIQQPAYETDGLREFAGDVRIVNQLDYLGLWSAAGALVGGNVIAIAKGLAEGQFYFGTDASNALYYTPDNFVTASQVGGNPLAAGERIIKIVQRGTDDFWFCITDSAGTGIGSGGGKVYAWDNVGGAWVAGATTLYYDLDVPVQMQGGAGLTSPGGYGGRAIGPSNTDGASPYNAYINHAQTVTLTRTQNNNAAIQGTSRTQLKSGSSLTGATPTLLYNVTQAGTFSISPQISVAAGLFVGAFCFKDTGLATTQWDIQLLQLNYTRREFPRWRGGTFDPQAFWDAANNRLVFLASSAEDASQNRTTQIRSVNSACVVTTWATTNSVSALANDGTNLYWATYAVNTTGFTGTLAKGLLATPGTVVTSAALTANSFILLLAYESTGGVLLVSAKSFVAGTQEFFTFTARVDAYPSGLLTPVTSLLVLGANGDSGPVVKEFTKQTTTPYKWFAFVGELTTVAIYELNKELAAASDVSVFKTQAYISPSASGSLTGILSNALFVPSSDAAGNYLWADRLYWFGGAAITADGRMVQLGVPGTWTVKGGLTSKQNNLGSFSALGNLGVTYSGDTAFWFRNAADAASLAASERSVTPNQAIQGFSPVLAWAQWRAFLTWAYSVANPIASPTLSVVDVAYFIGTSSVPRPVAEHWDGRTYFALAEDGQAGNNIVLVYDKKNAWTVYRGWRIKTMKKFRGILTAFQDYEFVQLEVGTTDLGGIIRGVARTGVLSNGDAVAVEDAQINVESTLSQDFPTNSGFIKMTTLKGEDEGEFPKMIEIPPSANKEIRRVNADPLADFGWDWAQAFSLEFKTSDETSGAFVPTPDQQETVQQVDLKLLATPASREYTGK